MGYSVFGDSHADAAGVTPVIGEQSTDAAARQAVEEQKYGDEFNPKPHPDTESYLARLNEVDNRLSEITVQLYGTNSMKLFIGPEWLEKERLHKECEVLDDERRQIIFALRQIVEATGL